MSSDPKWLNLIQTCLQHETGNPASRFIQLATLTTDGQPAVRTVVFRGWFTDTSQQRRPPATALKIITDTRSEKVSALRKHPWAEICWYFVQARKQFRLTTTNVRVIEQDEVDPFLAKARKDQWTALSDAARLQFRYPAPGASRPRVMNGKDPFTPESPSPSHPEETFALLLVEPQNVDVLDLRANERWLFSREDDHSWKEAFLNP